MTDDEGALYASEISTLIKKYQAAQKVSIPWDDLTNGATTSSYHIHGVGVVTISTPTLRCICRAIQVFTHARSVHLKSLKILEIYADTGEQCCVIHQLAALYNIAIESYTIFDHPNELITQQSLIGLNPQWNVIYVNPLQKHLDTILTNTYFLFASTLLEPCITQALEHRVSHGFLLSPTNTFPETYYNMMQSNETVIKSSVEKPRFTRGWTTFTF
jgi:hypothetical protein